jgi:tRNA modification GTPase
MSYVDLVDETICALVTAPGLSGISVVRVSGPRALEIVKKHCSFLPEAIETHRAYFGKFKTFKQNALELIDECLVTYFAQGKSFTGDETLELSLHGGHSCAHRVLSDLQLSGCRAAERGEFSFRAFYNGKIDLVQAEAIHSLIKSRSDLSRSQAIKQLSGRVSQKLNTIESQLIQVLAQLEASIDFSTEDIEPYSFDKMKELLATTLPLVEELVLGYEKGRILSEGLQVVLAGAPNSGKSSLYNAILGDEKAIVSEVPGTTRDFLETPMNEFSLPIRLVDTAGLRETKEVVELEGIKRTQAKLENADVVFYLLDSLNPQGWDITPLMGTTSYLDKTVFLLTKSDQVSDNQALLQQARQFLRNHLSSQLSSQKECSIYSVSSLNGDGLQVVRDKIKNISLVDIHHDESVITQHRQFIHLNTCKICLENAMDLLKKTSSYDLVALEIQTALREVFNLLGKEFDEQVLDQVFKQFCIGK